MDKTAYHYNKKKTPAKTAGKYLYYYPCADEENATVQIDGRGFITVEVSEEEWETLIELDRFEYNNQHKETRRRVKIGDEEENDFTDGRGGDINTFSENEITGGLTVEEDISSLKGKEKRIAELRFQSGLTQREIAEELGVTQGYVSAALKNINVKLSEDEQDEEETLNRTWRQIITKGEADNDFDIYLEYGLRCLNAIDLFVFMHWFYSFGELCKYMMRYMLFKEETAEREIEDYINVATETELKHFKDNYADKASLMQVMYIRLKRETERRAEIYKVMPMGKAYYRLDETIDKIAKRVNMTADEFVYERFMKGFSSKRQKRYNKFYRKYFGTDMPGYKK